MILDSSVLIGVERGALDLDARLAVLGEETVSISAVTASELLHGVHRAKTESQRTRRGRFVERVLADIPVAPFALPEARVHARLGADLKSRGITVGPHDLLIAATALTVGFRLATANLREFRRIPGLEVEDWSDAGTAGLPAG